MFCLFPAQAAAVWSVDSGIQTWSTCFGLLAVWSLQRFPTLIGGSLFCLFTCIAVLWKESGIAWFMAAPLFAAILPKSAASIGSLTTRRNLLLLLTGMIGASLYFFVRKRLGPDILGDEMGRYAIHWVWHLWLKNAAMLFGVSVSTVETVSLFGIKNGAAALLSVVDGTPLLLWVCNRVVRERIYTQLWVGAVAVLLLIAPHVVLGRVSEMYADSVIAGMVIWIVGGLKIKASSDGWGLFRVVFSLALVTCAVVSAHKWVQMYRTGERAAKVADAIVSFYGVPTAIPRQVCSLTTTPGYSVFYSNAPTASGWGLSVWAKTGWRLPEQLIPVSQIDMCPTDIAHIWRIDPAGKITEIIR
jgi:hypothetical protein